MPGYETVTWFGLYGPKGLPADLVARVNTAANQALSDPEVRAKLASRDAEEAEAILGGEPLTTDEAHVPTAH